MARAERHGDSGLYLRSLVFAADEKIGVGNRSGAWEFSLAGLERYWSGPYPSGQVYNLYGGLAYDAGSRDQFNIQIASWREAIAALGSGTNLWRPAIAHQTLAGAAHAAHRPRLAHPNDREDPRPY